MRRRWPATRAIDVLYKTQTGSYVELSTELPKELVEEIMKKLIDHATSKPPGAPADTLMTAEEKAVAAGRNLRGQRLLCAPSKRKGAKKRAR